MRLLASVLTLTLVLPSLAAAQDADGDGLSNDVDFYPCDPAITSVSFAPAENEHGMLLFEDRWPAEGDLDFNDLSLGYNYVFRSDAAGGVWSMHVTFNVLALGGTLHNGLGLVLPVPRSSVASVTRTIEGQSSVALAPSTADENLTVRVSDDLRSLFGSEEPVNSRSDAPGTAGRIIELEITFNQAAAIGAAGAPFDVFMFRTSDAGHEIHAPSYSGTAAMNAGRFNTSQDSSADGRWFVDTHGIPFVLSFPAIVSYPGEGVKIDQLFPDIVDFASSGGATNRDFYLWPAAASAYVDQNGAGAPLPRLLQPEQGDQSCLTVCSGNASIAADGQQASVSPPAGAAAVFTACGAAGQRWAVATSVSSGCYDHDVFNARGTELLNTFRCSSGFDELLPLTGDGDVTFDITPRNAGVTARITLWNVPADATATLVPPATGVSLPITTPAQNGRIFFEASAGQRLSYQVRRSAGCFRDSLIAPDGAVVIAPGLDCGTTFSELLVLPQSGQYTLVLDPNSSDVPTFTIDVWTVPEDVVVNGSFGRSTITISAPSQNGSLTFSGSAGQRVSILTRPSTGCFRQTVTAPSGATLVSPSLRCGSYFTDVITLSESGQHTVFLDPNSSDRPIFTVDVYDVPPDPTLPIAISDAARSLAMAAPGSNGALTFSASAGQRISMTTNVSSGCFRQILTAANGTVVSNSGLRCGNNFLDVTVLPADGTYTLALDPNDADQPTFTVDVFDVPPDGAVNAAIAGGAVTMPLTTPGQNGVVTFEAAAGQRVTIQTTRTAGCYREGLRAPSGVLVLSPSLRCGTFTLSNQSLPETGVYRVEIDPNGSDTATFTVNITNGT